MRLVAASLLALSVGLAPVSGAFAEVRILGTVTKVETIPDGAVATLKEAKSGDLVEITVTDKLTLDRFRDHRISVGDEIKCRYEISDGKKVAISFKKPGGCT